MFPNTSSATFLASKPEWNARTVASGNDSGNGACASSGADEGLLLASCRHVRSNNSWMHNVKVLVKGKDRCTLLIHPEDAKRTGVADGSPAQVSSAAGTIEVPVEVVPA